jgi:hypothetical protein
MHHKANMVNVIHLIGLNFFHDFEDTSLDNPWTLDIRLFKKKAQIIAVELQPAAKCRKA